MGVMFAYVTAGLAPGLDVGHDTIYLQMTCVAWAIVGLVLPILRLVRIIALPLWFVLLVYCDMYLYVISLCQGMFMNLSWWGDFTHVLAAMVVTSIVFMALCIMESHSPPHVRFGSRGGMVAILIILGASFGGIWEIMEGYTDILAGRAYMSYGAPDTLGDLSADVLGVLMMSIAIWFILGKQSAKDIAAKVRMGRKAFDD